SWPPSAACSESLPNPPCPPSPWGKGGDLRYLRRHVARLASATRPVRSRTATLASGITGTSAAAVASGGAPRRGTGSSGGSGGGAASWRAVVGMVGAGVLPGTMAGLVFVAVKVNVPEPVLVQEPDTPLAPPGVYWTVWPTARTAGTPGVPPRGGWFGGVVGAR